MIDDDGSLQSSSIALRLGFIVHLLYAMPQQKL